MVAKRVAFYLLLLLFPGHIAVTRAAGPERIIPNPREAAIAHELGHVWIFTHHPFLQTEVLANQIAQRLVPRSSLVQVYEKVWKRQGTEGDLSRFVGD